MVQSYPFLNFFSGNFFFNSTLRLIAYGHINLENNMIPFVTEISWQLLCENHKIDSFHGLPSGCVCVCLSASTFLQVSWLHSDDHDEISGEKTTAYILRKMQYSSEKAMSLPSSPHGGRAFRWCGPSYLVGDDDDMISRCNKVLDLSKILNKSLEPFEEWNRILISLNKLLELELGLVRFMVDSLLRLSHAYQLVNCL